MEPGPPGARAEAEGGGVHVEHRTLGVRGDGHGGFPLPQDRDPTGGPTSGLTGDLTAGLNCSR
ncbi:hypothetical protein ACWCPF_33655 [Streptomyces sp. NPDC001858]